MRAKRVRALVAGAVVTPSERRAMKRQHYLSMQIKAGSSKERGGVPSGGVPDVSFRGRFREASITAEIGEFFRELSPMGKRIALALMASQYTRAHEPWDPRGMPRRPVLGTGLASSMSRHELRAAVQHLRGFVGINQIAGL